MTHLKKQKQKNMVIIHLQHIAKMLTAAKLISVVISDVLDI